MDILIAGAGLGGVAFAAALRALGSEHRVTFVERDPDPIGPQFGLMLTPNAIAALGRVGLDDTVRSAGVELQQLAVVGPDGETLHAEDLRNRPLPTVGIRRRDLLAALAPTVEASIVRGATVASATPEGDRLLVRLADGSERRVDLLVGADGTFSTVRPLVDGAQPQYRSTLTWRALVERPDGMPDGGVLCDAGGLQFGAYPVAADGPGSLHVFVYTHEPTFTHLPPTEHLRRLRQLAARFEPAVGVVATAAATAVNVVHTPIFEVQVAEPTAHGRIALIGDAAHAFVATGSQGGAMAVEDAVSLALSLVSETDCAAALDRYTAVRHPRWSDVRAVTRYRSAMSGLEGPEVMAAGVELFPTLPDAARLHAENLNPPL